MKKKENPPFALTINGDPLTIDGQFLSVYSNFISRAKELQTLNDLIWQGPQAIAITGKTGVGKSTLLTMFITQLNENINVKLITPLITPDVNKEIDNFLVRIRLSNEIKRHLVIIDGVDRFHVDELQDYLRKILNYKAIRAVIFTSQKTLTNIPGISEIRLESFSQAELLNWSKSNEGIIYDLNESQIIEAVRPEIIIANDTLIEKLKKEPKGLYKITPRQFEEVIADLLSDMGWEVSLTKATRDGGKDILAYKNTGLNKILCLVEAKKYKESKPIGIGLVRQLHSTLMHEKANMAMMVTTSRFSNDSHNFQKNYEYQLSLREYMDIVSWLLNYKSCN